MIGCIVGYGDTVGVPIMHCMIKGMWWAPHPHLHILTEEGQAPMITCACDLQQIKILTVECEYKKVFVDCRNYPLYLNLFQLVLTSHRLLFLSICLIQFINIIWKFILFFP